MDSGKWTSGGGGPRARANALVGAVLLLFVLSLGGCSNFNFRAWNSDMSEKSIDQRVQEKFPIGTAYADVDAAMTKMDLPHGEMSKANAPPGDYTRCMSARLSQGWYHLFIIPVSWEGGITFYFDEQDRLLRWDQWRGAVGP